MADDQGDVARTLCNALKRAGAHLKYATDGRSALDQISSNVFDLVLIDMKMPPDEWGGLWLLQQLQSNGYRLPSLVLSGEGSKQQVIEALRLGTADWIVKDQAGEELLPRCGKLLTDRLAESLDYACGYLPTPVAYRFARYVRMTDPEKKVIEGLHALESVLRFIAILGLSTTPARPLRAITAGRLAAPSMGTWFDMCTALADSATETAARYAAELLSWVAPERSDRSVIQDLVTLRNSIAHGRGEPSSAQAECLDGVLRRFAHRASSLWRAELIVPTSMTYDGSSYDINVCTLRGVGKPVPGTIKLTVPVISGNVFIVSEAFVPFSLAPWLVIDMNGLDDLRCLQFDGLQRGKAGIVSDTPFKYSDTAGGDYLSPVAHPEGRWETLAPWANH
ncbi:hypothetical protein Mth01_57350 [Sphaerimonospora thailandensis]|uniref:Response regulatory domain-containing protein n=1 Tax=Sphaerimonospora thailandensis TaxID=795644 RepID=A0A8J3RGJ8_9ACTN|nr:hypothetical protein Mth01_57350 [Sphaerimonospora thailandensis]